MIRQEISHLAVPVSSLKNHPKNVRQGDVGAISQSLQDNGQYRPIVVQKSTGYVLAGNHTLKAARALGWEQVAATFVDCDDDRALRILLADNKTNDLAHYDETALADLLKELAESEKELAGTLYTGDDLDDLLFKADFSHGNTVVGSSAQELADQFWDKRIRSLILPYPEDEHQDIVARLDEIGAKLGLETHSEIVKHILATWKS